jgi:glycine oxidase
VAVPDTADVILVGGGVMGCASALALAGEGLRVRVLERSVPGAEASSAAAGILGAQTEAHEAGPFFELARQSRASYAQGRPALQQWGTTATDHAECCGLVRDEAEKTRGRHRQGRGTPREQLDGGRRPASPR